MDNHQIKTKLVSHYNKLSRTSIYNHFTKKNVDLHDNIDSYQLNPYQNLFETKGQTLIALNKQLNDSVIEQIFTFTVRDYLNNRKKIINKIRNKFNKK